MLKVACKASLLAVLKRNTVTLSMSNGKISLCLEFENRLDYVISGPNKLL